MEVHVAGEGLKFSKLVYGLNAGLRNTVQSCQFLSRPELFMRRLISAFLTNSTYIAASVIRTGNLWICATSVLYLFFIHPVMLQPASGSGVVFWVSA